MLKGQSVVEMLKMLPSTGRLLFELNHATDLEKTKTAFCVLCVGISDAFPGRTGCAAAALSRHDCQHGMDHARGLLGRDRTPGLGCTTTSQTDPTPPRRTWHLKLKLSLSQKVGCTAAQKLSPNPERQFIWAESHETGGFSATLAVGR